MKYKRGDFVHTSYNEIGVVLEVETDAREVRCNSYFIRLASGETTWFTGANLYPLSGPSVRDIKK